MTIITGLIAAKSEVVGAVDNDDVVKTATRSFRPDRDRSRHLSLVSSVARSDLSYFWDPAFVNVDIEVLVTCGGRKSHSLSCERANACKRVTDCACACVPACVRACVCS